MSNFYAVWIPYERMDDWLRGGLTVRRKMTPRFWLFMIFTTIVVFSVSLGVLQFRYNQGARELARIRDYRDGLDLQVRDLTAELEYANTDAFIIRAARDELGLIMPSEVRYVNGSN